MLLWPGKIADDRYRIETMKNFVVLALLVGSGLLLGCADSSNDSSGYRSLNGPGQRTTHLVALNQSAASEMPCADWEQPKFALFCTGRQHGYIEPCGCTGLENAKGGLSRRDTFLQHLRGRGWDIVPVDVGNQIRRFGAQAEIKLNATADLLREMEYAAVGLGPDDLRISLGELLAAIGDDTIFTSANTNVLDFTPKSIVVDAGGAKIGVVAVMGEEHQQKVNSTEIEFVPAKDGLTAVLPELERDCDHIILLAHASKKETYALAKQFPKIELIVTAAGAGEPTLEPEMIEGSAAQIIQVGTKGMYVGVVGYYPGADPPFRYARVELDDRFEDSDRVMQRFALYQKQLEGAGLERLGLRPVKHPRGDRTFVGHEVCGECHTEAYEIFVDTPHFEASQSIMEPTERATIPRHHDPECLSCHVTGWNPQEYFPYVSGYFDEASSKHVMTNGCENCHGPGSKHVAAENGDINVTDQELEALRVEMRLTLEEARKTKCLECHDLDNSPDFDFDSYWPEVEHYGVD